MTNELLMSLSTRRSRVASMAGKLAIAVASLMLVAGAAQAKDDPLPDGDWRQHCNNGRMNGNELKANCRAPNGRMLSIEANVADCRGWVSYDVNRTKFYCSSNRGQGYGPGYNQGYGPGYNQGYGPGYNQGYGLGYNQGYGPGYGQGNNTGGYPMPAGQWSQYCTNGYMDGSALKASCRRSDGSYRHTEANIGDCRGGSVLYSMQTGQFRCSSYGQSGGTPYYGR